MTSAELLEENGYNGVVIFKNYSFDSALIGVSEDNRAIYDFEKMVAFLMNAEGWNEDECIEWIEYNTIRSLPYFENAPIIMYPLSR